MCYAILRVEYDRKLISPESEKTTPVIDTVEVETASGMPAAERTLREDHAVLRYSVFKREVRYEKVVNWQSSLPSASRPIEETM